MEAQNAFFRHANVLPRDVAQEHRARGQAYSRNPYVRMLQRDLLPLLLIEKKESAAIVGDFDCLRACRGGDQRKQSGQEETPSSHSGLALIPRQKRGMRTRQAAVYSIGRGSHTISFGNVAP